MGEELPRLHDRRVRTTEFLSVDGLGQAADTPKRAKEIVGSETARRDPEVECILNRKWSRKQRLRQLSATRHPPIFAHAVSARRASSTPAIECPLTAGLSHCYPQIEGIR